MRKFTYRIEKKGRRWLQGVSPEGYRAQIPINELTKDWKEGETYTFYGRLELERSRFGTKAYVYPLSDEELNREKLAGLEKEYKRWKGYVEESAREGRLYHRGINKLLSIAEEMRKLGHEERAREVERSVEEAKQAVVSYKEKDAERYFERVKEELESSEGIKSSLENLKELSLEEAVNEALRLFSKTERLRENFYKLQNRLSNLSLSEKERLIYEEAKELVHTLEATKSAARYILKVLEEENPERLIRSLSGLLGEKFPKARPYLEQPLRRKVGELSEKIEERERKTAEEFKLAFESLKDVFPQKTLVKLAKQGKLKNEKYLPLKIRDGYLAADLLEKLGALLHAQVVGKRVNEKLMREAGPAGVIVGVLAPEFMMKDVKEYTWYVPESSYEKASDIATLMRSWETALYRKLASEEGTPVDCPEFPTSWNHLKKQYVALVDESMNLNFVSKRENFSRSGRNASLVVDYKFKEGDLVVAKDGSHKHMFHTFYRLDRDGWKELLTVEARDWWEAKKKLFELYLKPELEEILERGKEMPVIEKPEKESRKELNP